MDITPARTAVPKKAWKARQTGDYGLGEKSALRMALKDFFRTQKVIEDRIPRDDNVAFVLRRTRDSER